MSAKSYGAPPFAAVLEQRAASQGTDVVPRRLVDERIRDAGAARKTLQTRRYRSAGPAGYGRSLGSCAA